jgi:hypothetical protein
LFGDDFYEKYAQNVGGQFKDPYHNFLMTGARKIGPDADINRLYQQYQASGRTDTPDWATLDTTGPITTLPMLAHKWDASGGTPVERLSSAWNPTTPLIEGVTVPEGYWDNYLAYNMNMSKIHPSLVAEGGASNVQQLLDSNAQARYAMSQGEYGNQGPIFNSYIPPAQLAQKMQSDQMAYQQAVNHYNRQREINNEWARINKVDASEANSNLDALLAEAESRFAAVRAQDEARAQAQIQQQMNSARYARGGQVTARGFAEGGAVKDPFADMSMLDKVSLLARGAKKRYIDHYDAASKHGAYPDQLAAALKDKYLVELGNSRRNRTPLDVAINYGGGYDFAANKAVPAQDVRDMAKAYQLFDYMTSIRDSAKADAIGDYYENMAGVEAGLAGRSRGRMPESEIQRLSAEYGKKKATAAPAYTEGEYAEGGLVYNDYDEMFEFR